MAECPRCKGVSISRRQDMHSTKAGTPAILIRTRCDACGFSVFNVLWSENGSPVIYGWMTGQETPTAISQYTEIPMEDLR